MGSERELINTLADLPVRSIEVPLSTSKQALILASVDARSYRNRARGAKSSSFYKRSVNPDDLFGRVVERTGELQEAALRRPQELQGRAAFGRHAAELENHRGVFVGSEPLPCAT